MRISRTRVLIAILAVTGIFAFAHSGQAQAATGGSALTFGTDPTITSTSTGVTSSQVFPDGTKAAQCFIQATSHTGAQTTTFGNCAGLGLNLTCASGEYTGTPPDKGAALTINGTASWKGVYDNGNTCATGVKVANSPPTLTADVTGLTPGQTVVFFFNTDAGNGFNSPNGRNGCLQYFEGTTGTTQQCVQLNYTNGPGGSFYEVTVAAATGTIEQTIGTASDHNGNMSFGGVFINTSGATSATSTPLPAPPTATAVPTVNPSAVKPSAISQFGTDITLTTLAGGVTSSVPFPDGGTAAMCFIKIDQKSGVQTGTNGDCRGLAVNVTCSSFQFSSNPTTDQHGAAIVQGTTRTLSGAYDTGPSCTTVANATLSYDITGLTAGQRVITWWNNDSGASRDGCVAFKDATGIARQGCFANTAAGRNGTFYEVVSGGGTGTAYEFQAPQNNVGSSGNATAGGVFITAVGGTPLSASVITSRIHHAYGMTHITWTYRGSVRGFNVYNGTTKLNHTLVTSRSNNRYSFWTAQKVRSVRLEPVS